MPPKYVIINDVDAPEPRCVCQWVPDKGYCYLDRSGDKPRYDGMPGDHATSVEAFGWEWTDKPDGTVSFSLSDRPFTATYPDGESRRWQHEAISFSFRRRP
jgi:hypothetical protein